MNQPNPPPVTGSPANVSLARAYAAGLASTPLVIGIFLVAAFWRPLAAGWPVVAFPLLVAAAGEPARRVLADVSAARVALVGGYAFSLVAVGLGLIVVATVNPIAIIAWLGCLPAWAAIAHQTLRTEARPPTPPATSVGWRHIVIALALGLGAGVPAALLAGIGVLLLALSGIAGGDPSNGEIGFWLVVLELLVVATVSGGVVFALRRFTDRAAAATAGAALGIGTSAGAITYALLDSHRPLIVAATVCFVVAWLATARWWLNRHSTSPS
jgi:hypothetical protein